MADAVATRQGGEHILFYTWTPNWTLNEMVPGEDVVWIQVPDRAPQGDVPTPEAISSVEGCVADPCRLGYADISMDDLTAQAGLTRGAFYHHFGDKKGLLAAVVEQIDAETDQRLHTISDRAEDAWEGFRNRCRAYLEMALEPEIHRIVLRDARAVLGGASPESQRHCIQSMQRLLDNLMRHGIVDEADPQALASLIYGSLAEAAFWIADGEDGSGRLERGMVALDLLLRGLLVKR